MSSGFEFIHEEKSDRAIMLFHGLTGSPFEMKNFGKYLYENGFDVFGICLPGHGDLQSEIYTVKYTEWIDCASKNLEKLCEKYKEVFLGGLCLGAVISLYLGEKYGVELPICQAVHNSVTAKIAPQKAISELFLRSIKKEF